MQKPTLNEIYNRVLTDLTGSAQSSRRVFAKAIAGCSYLLHGYADKLSSNLHPLNARGKALESWAAVWLQEGRKPPEKASGSLTVEATAETELPAGTLFRYGDIEFSTTKDIRFSGLKEVPVVAVRAGKIRPIKSGEQLGPVQTIANLTRIALVTETIDGGADEESDEALRERIRERVRTPPQGGAPQDYIVWAKSVPGISRAWSAPRIEGKGTVGLCFVNDENGGISSRQTGESLAKKLAEVGPGGTEFIIRNLQAQPIDFHIQVEPFSEEVADRIKSELKTLIKAVSEPVFQSSDPLDEGKDPRFWLNSRGEKTTGVLTTADVHEAISLVPKDRYRVVLPDPQSDVFTQPGKIMTLGEVKVDSF